MTTIEILQQNYHEAAAAQRDAVFNRDADNAYLWGSVMAQLERQLNAFGEGVANLENNQD